ncbi:MAG: T9SS type A sorting domain-containing protein [Bacteroidetes bacterium]|nr:T9SS type A sorting domain-containing protein [Bacteroidota bacterium]
MKHQQKIQSSLLLPFGKAGMGFLLLLLPLFSFAQTLATSSVGEHSLAICTDSTVRAWGLNSLGQIGDNTNTDRWTPVRVLAGASASGCGTYLCKIIVLAAGYSHSLAIKSDGTVWGWGWNSSGQIGDNTTTNKWTPVQVLAGASGCGTYLCNITAVVAGNSHSMALKSDGTVWSWGNNGWGQLGDNTTTQRNTPVQVSGLTGIVAIAAGRWHSIALKNDGTVWTWGRNMNGELGDNTFTDRWTPVQVHNWNNIGFFTNVVTIASGGDHVLALKNDGTVWAWGSDGNGQLGDNAVSSSRLPLQVHGPGNSGFLSGIVKIAGGAYHSIAIKNDGTVWTWGSGGNGELGNGTTVWSLVPVQVLTGSSGCTTYLCDINSIAGGTNHSSTLKNDGTIWDFGINTYGGLGDNTTTNRNTPVQPIGLCSVKLPMPVELLSFNAIAEDNTRVRCEWSTASEINNDYFAIERSKDGTNFSQIGTVKGAGNSSVTLNYTFYDHEPYSGLSYYRLKQFDYNGAFTYSQIRAVYIGTLNLITIYPNPSTDGSIQYIIASEDGGELSVKVYDIIGRKVISNTETLEGGVITKKLSTAALSSGSYLLQITNGNLEKTQKQFVIR